MKFEYTARNSALIMQITGKFNVIVGDSGSGKSLLAELADWFSRANENVVVKPKPIFSNIRQDITRFITSQHDVIIVIDEGFDGDWLRSNINAMKKSDNYYVFITRDGIAELPYGIGNIFHVVQLKGRRCEMTTAVDPSLLQRKAGPSKSVIVEDAGVGFQLMQRIVGEINVVSAKSKSRLCSCIAESQRRPLVVFDSCGIGYEWQRLESLTLRGYCTLFDSVSLEHEILSTTFSKYFEEFSLEHARHSLSEENFYVMQLRSLLNSLFGISYTKADEQVTQLLEDGVANFHSQIVRLRDVGCASKKAYSELRQKSVGSAAGVQRLDLGSLK